MTEARLPGGGDSVCVGAEIDEEARLFGQSLERYRRVRRRPFPTASEVLAVAVSLGYRKVAEPTELPGAAGTDEPPTEPASAHVSSCD